MNLIIVIGYAIIYYKLKSYHQDLIEYQSLDTEQTAALKDSMRRIFKFFLLIN